MWTDSNGMQPHPVPSAMSETDIAQAIAEYAHAAKRAIEAGFDGIELHGANGYLIDQFLNTASNQRTDRWGGGIENRIRFAVEVAKACADAIGAERVGMRISPYGVFNGMVPDAGMDMLYEQLIAGLNNIGLAYIHIVDHSSMGAPEVSSALKAKIRAGFKGKYILSGGYDLVRANADLDANRGDLVAFGRPYLANPDLVQKLQSGTALAAPDPATFYTPGEKGYTDY
jgi:N-ethylmaleimide reductase